MTSRLSFSTTNILKIALTSPVLAAQSKMEAYPYQVPLYDPVQNLHNRNFIRKTQSDFGWDWGPAFASSGIYKNIYLTGFNTAALLSDRLLVQQFHTSQMTPSQIAHLKRHAKLAGVTPAGVAAATAAAASTNNNDDDNDVFLKITTFYRTNNATDFQGKVQVQLFDQTTPVTSNYTTFLVSRSSLVTDVEGLSAVEIWLYVQAPQLWYCVGYGTPYLYQLSLTYIDNNNNQQSFSKSIGFRTIELVREPVPDNSGLSFYFSLNSIPVFVKGANMIPFDSFHSRVTQRNISDILQALYTANGNLIRVWGGGLYQQDYLYELADQLGILIWQEFTFACAMYPRDDTFLNNVRIEVAQQVRRLAYHASMTVFGGNNENEAALTWGPVTANHRDLYVVDYWKLYVETIRDELLKQTGSEIPYVVSSPSEGPLTELPFTQRWGNAQSSQYGDVHYYNYLDNCANLTVLPTPRFVSEFGHQSLPSDFTLYPMLPADQLVWNSSVLNYRQRHPDGYEQLYNQMAFHFYPPANQTDLLAWIYLTQVNQAFCYSIAFNHWRRLRSWISWNMGIVYWQLNDIWQAPTWSSLEYGGRRKLLHYAVARAYAPVIVNGFVTKDGENVQFFVVSDVNQPITGTVDISVIRFSDNSIFNHILAFESNTGGSQNVWNSTLAFLLEIVNCASASDCVIVVTGTITSPASPPVWPWPSPLPTNTLPREVVWLSEPRESTILPAHLTFQVTNLSPDGTSATVQVTSDVLAVYVWIESSIPGSWSDNGLCVLAGETVSLTFTPPAGEVVLSSVAEFQESLRITSLTDTFPASHWEKKSQSSTEPVEVTVS